MVSAYSGTSASTLLLNNVVEPVRIAVIGGTGISSLPGFTLAATLDVDTPWGKPSSPIAILQHPSPTTGNPIPVAFLSRHGLHHELAPHEVKNRANLAALRHLGVRTIIAFFRCRLATGGDQATRFRCARPNHRPNQGHPALYLL